MYKRKQDQKGLQSRPVCSRT